MKRRSAEEERARRADKRAAWEASEAAAWLFDKVPDDPELRAYVHAHGALLVANRAHEKWTRETIAAGEALLEARAKHRAANDTRRRWKAVRSMALASYDEARDAFRREQWRKEHAGELDHSAHVWAWYRSRWEKVGKTPAK